MSLELWEKFCSKCTENCCKRGTPVIHAFEREAIIKAGAGEYIEEHDGYSILQGNPCPLWKDEKCTIQHCKPLDCHAYPMFIKPGKNGEPEWMVDPKCPASAHLPLEFIEAVKALFNKLTPEEQELDWKVALMTDFHPIKL